MTVVSISQPSVFPWVGQFEKLIRSDVHIVLDDVTFQKDGFLNRVRLKAPPGPRYVTVSIADRSSFQRIDEVHVDPTMDLQRPLRQLDAWYCDAPFHRCARTLLEDYLDLVAEATLVEAAIASLRAVFAFVHLPCPEIIRSSTLESRSTSSERLIDLVRRVSGHSYLYGPGRPGRADYLDHAAFDRLGIERNVMTYRDHPYAQMHGAFVARLSILDGVSMYGPGTAHLVSARTC